MADSRLGNLSRRERQIMDVVYQRGRASVADVVEDLVDAPSYSAVRTLIGILESKGHLRHVKEGLKYIYLPTRRRRTAGQAALRRALRTFYDGSVEKAVAALLDLSDSDLSDEEADRLAELIAQSRREGQ